MRLVPDSAFPAWIETQTLFNALVIGFTAALVVMAFYLWLAVREIAFAWYSAYLLCYLSWFTFIGGYCRSRLWPESYVLSSATIGCFCFFLSSLLGMRKSPPWMLTLPRCLAAMNLLVAFVGASKAVEIPWMFRVGLQAAGLVSIFAVLVRRAFDDSLARQLLVAITPPVGATLLGYLIEWNLLSNFAFKKRCIVVCAFSENVLTALILVREVLRREKRRLILERDFEGKVLEQSDKYWQIIAHDLHDDLSQRILAVRLTLHNESKGSVPPQVESQLQALADAVREISHQLAPAWDGSRSLHSALFELARAMNGESLEIRMDLACEEEYSPSANMEIFHIVQEALSNAVRHGKASRVEVRTRPRPRSMELSIGDNGVGMDASIVSGLGLESIRSRVARLGGTLQIQSAKGRGTKLILRIPLGDAAG